MSDWKVVQHRRRYAERLGQLRTCNLAPAFWRLSRWRPPPAAGQPRAARPWRPMVVSDRIANSVLGSNTIVFSTIGSRYGTA